MRLSRLRLLILAFFLPAIVSSSATTQEIQGFEFPVEAYCNPPSVKVGESTRLFVLSQTKYCDVWIREVGESQFELLYRKKKLWRKEGRNHDRFKEFDKRLTFDRPGLYEIRIVDNIKCAGSCYVAVKPEKPGESSKLALVVQSVEYVPNYGLSSFLGHPHYDNHPLDHYTLISELNWYKYLKSKGYSFELVSDFDMQFSRSNIYTAYDYLLIPSLPPTWREETVVRLQGFLLEGKTIITACSNLNNLPWEPRKQWIFKELSPFINQLFIARNLSQRYMRPVITFTETGQYPQLKWPERLSEELSGQKLFGRPGISRWQDEFDKYVIAEGQLGNELRAAEQALYKFPGGGKLFCFGIDNWSELLGYRLKAVKSFTSQVISHLTGLQPKESEVSPSPARAPLYGGMYETLLTREFGGLASYLFYAPPGTEFEHLDCYDNGKPLGLEIADRGQGYDFQGADGFYTYLIDAPPSERTSSVITQVALQTNGGENLLWPYLHVHKDLHKVLNTETPNTLRTTPEKPDISSKFDILNYIELTDIDPDEASDQPGLTYPLIDVNYMYFFKKTFLGRPQILIAGYSTSQISSKWGGTLRFEAACFHSYGLNRITDVIVTFKEENIFQLYDNGEYGDRVPGDGISSRLVRFKPGLPPGDYLFGIYAWDSAWKRSDTWPYLVTHQGTDFSIPWGRHTETLEHILEQRKIIGMDTQKRWKESIWEALFVFILSAVVSGWYLRKVIHEILKNSSKRSNLV